MLAPPFFVGGRAFGPPSKTEPAGGFASIRSEIEHLGLKGISTISMRCHPLENSENSRRGEFVASLHASASKLRE